MCVCESLSMHAIEVASRFTSARLRCICAPKSASKAFSSSSISIRINVISQAASGKTLLLLSASVRGDFVPERGRVRGV